MTISIYDASVGVFQARLKGLAMSSPRQKRNAAERRIDPACFSRPGSRPTCSPDAAGPDRHRSCQGAPSRLAGRDVPKFDDHEQSSPTSMRGSAGRLIISRHLQRCRPGGRGHAPDRHQGRPARNVVPGNQYLLGYAMPNFYFHLTTAYAILRHNGVSLGKMDFFGVSG